MSKFILIFLLIPFTTLFGQTLRFDLMVKYSISLNGFNFERSTFGMSTNDNYMMQIFNNHDGSQTAKVFDLKSLKIYEYNLIEEKSNIESGEIKFVYLNTIPFSSYFPNISYERRINFDFEKLSTENDIETLNLTFYKNKSKTKPKGNLELKVLNSELNLFPLFRFTCLHTLECINELNYHKPGLVTSAISGNGYEKYTLKTFEEISLELSLPN